MNFRRSSVVGRRQVVVVVERGRIRALLLPDRASTYYVVVVNRTTSLQLPAFDGMGMNSCCAEPSTDYSGLGAATCEVPHTPYDYPNVHRTWNVS